MENTTYIALSRMDAQQRSMEVVANNIANANTDGFRAQRVLFSDYLSRQQNTIPSHGGAPYAYTQDRATYLDQREGAILPTGNPLDVALSGAGYFTVSTPQGTRLTRAGRFSLGQDGVLSDASGNAVLDVNGQPIQLSPSDTQIRIAGDGTISTENGQIGQIAVVTADTPADVRPIGGSLYATNSGTTPVAQPKVTQGAVEGSNVQSIAELTTMLQTQREFEFSSQFVEAEAQRRQNAIDKLGQASSS
ncbi:flagellar basal-body rod protein FlgF [Acetobacteraceae bacterium KSS8]|uniref:Flagellar basal-body rod protein FlgF n=1 Tax=Endosaccharibacter trunci TaxID=2812733 RepID=A0ABT1W9W0_9PROT|nr:flagellar basal-body rod protein FlgF [Acetobacteraceae bacterium KSS8]